MESIVCPICSLTVETIDHIFVGCVKLLDLQGRFAIWRDIQIPNPISIHSLLSWTKLVRLMGGQCIAFDDVVMNGFLAYLKFS